MYSVGYQHVWQPKEGHFSYLHGTWQDARPWQGAWHINWGEVAYWYGRQVMYMQPAHWMSDLVQLHVDEWPYIQNMICWHSFPPNGWICSIQASRLCSFLTSLVDKRFYLEVVKYEATYWRFVWPTDSLCGILAGCKTHWQWHDLAKVPSLWQEKQFALRLQVSVHLRIGEFLMDPVMCRHISAEKMTSLDVINGRATPF